MAKVTPCEAGYACPYCRQLDTSHTVSLMPHCPIVWIANSETNEVYDTLTGERMPFVNRPQPCEVEDDRRYDLIPVFTAAGGGKKKQTGIYRV